MLFSGSSTARKVVPATSSLPAPASIRPLRLHPPRRRWLLHALLGHFLRHDDDDFEAYSATVIIDHMREHQAAGPHFPLMPATICRLTPPGTMCGSGQGKDCGS